MLNFQSNSLVLTNNQNNPYFVLNIFEIIAKSNRFDLRDKLIIINNIEQCTNAYLHKIKNEITTNCMKNIQNDLKIKYSLNNLKNKNDFKRLVIRINICSTFQNLINIVDEIQQKLKSNIIIEDIDDYYILCDILTKYLTEDIKYDNEELKKELEIIIKDIWWTEKQNMIIGVIGAVKRQIKLQDIINLVRNIYNGNPPELVLRITNENDDDKNDNNNNNL